MIDSSCKALIIIISMPSWSFVCIGQMAELDARKPVETL